MTGRVMRQSIQLSSCKLDLRHDALRLPTRRYALRHTDFEDQYDFTTLFNDVFWSDDANRVILIGPPLLNLLEDLDLRFVALPSGAECRPVHQRKHWMDQISLSVPAATTGIAIDCSSVRFIVAPQPNLASLFEGRRAIFAMSKNNNLEWIRDWARFYALEHGCDAVLLYDNNSDRYGVADIYAAIRSAHDGLEVAVVAWPFPYGVFDGRREISFNLWDSYYSQSTLFEQARRRFLARAKSVINADIDELALDVASRSIFEMVEQSQTGFLRYRHGWWIENHLDVTPPDRRHRDYFLREQGGGEVVDWKWAVVPSRCPDQAQWWTHNIIGMAYDEASLDVRLRHMRPINTNWDIHDLLCFEARTSSYGGSAADLVVDEALRRSHERVFGEDAATAAPDTRPPETRAHCLRVLAGQAMKSGSPDEAVSLAREAHRLLPAHPGLTAYLADLLGKEGDAAKGEELRGEAMQQREADPAYHLQVGRLALFTGKHAEAQECFRKALELAPGFVEACRELVKCSSGHRPGRSLCAAVKSCLRSLEPDDHLSLASAAELCLKIGMADKALAAIDKALAMEPHWSYHQLRAQILKELGRRKEAIAAWQSAIALADNAAPSRSYPDHMRRQVQRASLGERLDSSAQHAALAKLLLQEGRAAEAERAARMSVEVNPRVPRGWLVLARCLALSGNDQAAAEVLARFRRLVRHILKNRKAGVATGEELAGMIDMLVIADGRDEAEAEIALARAAGVVNWQLEKTAADLALERNAQEEAVECLRRAIAMEPKQARLYSQLARVLSKQGKWEETADIWRALTAMAPEDARAHARLGETLARLKQADKAIASLQHAITLKGDVATWHYTLASLLARQERWAAAVAACRRAIELAPDLERAQRLLRECQQCV